MQIGWNNHKLTNNYRTEIKKKTIPLQKGKPLNRNIHTKNQIYYNVSNTNYS